MLRRPLANFPSPLHHPHMPHIHSRTLVLLLTLLISTACSGQAEDRPLPNWPTPDSPVQRCMNLDNALEAPTEGEWGYRIEDDHIKTIAHAGFDTIRVPVRWSAYAEKRAPYTIDPVIFARVDHVIETAESYGLNVIIDVHHYVDLFEYPQGHTERLKAIWQQIAAHYSSASDKLIFEMINEPHANMTPKITDRVNADILQIIRRTNPDRWVITGTANWGTLDGLLKSRPPADPKLIATFHYYGPYEFTHQGADFTDDKLPTGIKWGSAEDREMILADFAEAARFAETLGQPLLLGEFGVYEDVPLSYRTAWTQHIRRTAEAEGMGWCYWGFASNFKSWNPNSERWIAPIKEALLGD